MRLYDKGEMVNNRFEDFDEEEEGFSEGFSSEESMIPEGDYYDYGAKHNSYVEDSKINMLVLQNAIDLAKGSWFWRFKSAGQKMQIISDTYYFLLDLVKDS